MGALADLRARIVAALDGLDPDWNVHGGPVDALTPPAYMVVPVEPWLTRLAICSHEARLWLVIVAGRIEPDPGIETIESMIERGVAALDAARIPIAQVGAPGRFEIGGIAYLAARATIAAPVTIGGSL